MTSSGYLKLKVDGRPEDVQRLSEILRAAGITLEWEGDKRKFSPTAEWCNQKLGIRLPAAAQPSATPSPEVKIIERRKRGAATSKRSADKAGFVYLMPALPKGFKIGETKDPKSRRRTFTTKYPFEVVFIHLIPCSDRKALETRLHRQFAHRRMANSEFYDLTPADVELIKAMTGD